MIYDCKKTINEKKVFNFGIDFKELKKKEKYLIIMPE
jgi:hypothetical protein